HARPADLVSLREWAPLRSRGEVRRPDIFKTRAQTRLAATHSVLALTEGGTVNPWRIPMSEQDKIQRSNLPIPDQPHVGLTTYDAKDPDTKYPPIKELRPPKGAPNVLIVLIVLIDDTGFGATSAFGGPCHTPTLAKSRYLRRLSQLAELKGAGRQFRTLLQSLTMDFESASDKTFD